ncbi:hypothetical protein AM493_01135 [Flavobacterium akiainvivens]|uniref:Lipoprotein n=1 Tax=Flavobacterium akiainvivens TaxID=1202724 RepID=A0A0M8MEV6_9FLAO|nr:hypothetical protein [Flavobacterium akiainvivens]KOS04801.1 hypothetical protein AM493_01135 [Flavobacterium akiainvivens]SFQ43985.1 hypothetical protein SAMN05444144_104300 [Flavobacterium akiainvivens]
MLKHPVICLLALLFLSCTDAPQSPDPENTEVYLCDSPAAYSYHFNPNCKGLQQCKHNIYKTSLKTAKKHGRSFCGWEANDTIAR